MASSVVTHDHCIAAGCCFLLLAIWVAFGPYQESLQPPCDLTLPCHRRFVFAYCFKNCAETRILAVAC
eukprot:4396444-Amphidinium_carterae.1